AILKIKNVPQDTTLREAFLIFSLCLDEVLSVDIIDEVDSPSSNTNTLSNNNGTQPQIATSFTSQVSSTGSSNPVIVAKFTSIKFAQQVAQLLDDKCLFGTAFKPVKVEFTEEAEANPELYMENSSPNSGVAVPAGQNAPQHSSSTSSTSSGTISSSKRPSLGHQKSRFLFSDPFLGQHQPQSASSDQEQQTSPVQSESPQLLHQQITSQQQQSHHIPPQQAQPMVPANFGPSSQPNQNMLEQLTSPLLAASGTRLMMLDSQPEVRDYDQLVRPWLNSSNNIQSSRALPNESGTSLNGSLANGSTPPKSMPEPLTINTSLASGSSTPIANGVPTPTTTEWDRRRQGSAFFNGTTTATSATTSSQTPTSSSLSQSLLMNGSTTPSITSPPFQQPINQQLHQMQQQQIPELSLLARVPPPANPADQNPPCNTLYVGNLPPDATELELRALFQPQNGFRRLSFRTKQSTSSNVNSHHGPMCFVEFDDVSYATRALAELYGRTLPRANGNSSNSKGGIRLSFSKNPLGVRGPGQNRRGSSNPTLGNFTITNPTTVNAGGVGVMNGAGNNGYNGFSQFGFQQMSLSQYPK
ncbi:hypothetical protein CANARDRAFT_187724, partial [[Candida] arabinofermentans NRRL YB-2248]